MDEEEHSFASDIDDSNGDEVGFITYEELYLYLREREKDRWSIQSNRKHSSSHLDEITPHD